MGWEADWQISGNYIRKAALLPTDSGETPDPRAPGPHRSDARRPRAWASRCPGTVPDTRRRARAGQAARRRQAPFRHCALRLIAVRSQFGPDAARPPRTGAPGPPSGRPPAHTSPLPAPPSIGSGDRWSACPRRLRRRYGEPDADCLHHDQQAKRPSDEPGQRVCGLRHDATYCLRQSATIHGAPPGD